jgi:hypothetical protein
VHFALERQGDLNDLGEGAENAYNYQYVRSYERSCSTLRLRGLFCKLISEFDIWLVETLDTVKYRGLDM